MSIFRNRFFFFKKKITTQVPSSQLSLEIGREAQADRNHRQGGRSFYFFDFDDNVAYLLTGIYIFHKQTGEEIALSSGEFARGHHHIGKHGEFKDYELRMDDPQNGSFRDFRDHDIGLIPSLLGSKQKFVNDVLHILGLADYRWKGPSWDCFYHAVFNQRPLSIITARGHGIETVKAGIEQFVGAGYLPQVPNYLSIFPVSHPSIRAQLGDQANKASISELKKAAIHASVERAFSEYGENKYHRFGMSDDDPKNIELILQSMGELKKQYPENSFFVFDSSRGKLLKREVFTEHVVDSEIEGSQQMSLFDKS